MFPYKELSGAIHLHTRYSDGGVDYNTLINAAQAVGLDYVIVTDHMSLGGLTDNFEGIHKNVTVLAGYEHNDLSNHNHYLAMGVKNVFFDAKKPQEYIDSIRNGGGIGFIAHPAEKRRYINQFPPYPWTAWDADGYDGIEIWNQFSEWVEQLKSWCSFIKILYPRRFIDTAPADLLMRWDMLNCKRFVAGLGGVDAHTMTIRKGFFKFKVFPIKVELKGIRTHLFIPESTDVSTFQTTKQSILAALKKGNSFISNYRRGNASGTQIYLVTGSGNMLPPGQNEYTDQCPKKITVNIPKKATIKFLLNGKILDEKHSNYAEFTIISNGVYRVEVYIKNKAWIYSNPFPVGHYPFSAN